jgi:hypothetical protein
MIEYIYRFCDIETKLNIAKNISDLRPLKIDKKKYTDIHFALRIKKFKLKYNMVIFELMTRRLLI